MKPLIFILFIFSTLSWITNIFASEASSINLDFELMKADSPEDWNIFGNKTDYVYAIDKTTFHSGKQSGSIEFSGSKTGSGIWGSYVQAKYQGEKITLRGYLKTQYVSEGYAGLWLRVDPKVSFDMMENRGVIGTTDWQQYEITVDLKPSVATKIVAGGYLKGKGKVWIDNLELLVDGVPIVNTPVKKPTLAESDKEFDNGSNIVIPPLNKIVINNLQLMGRVWGFLKYYHPAIANGDYNWDYELFRALPEYLSSANQPQRDKVLLDWIEKLGTLKPCGKCKPADDDAFLSPDLNWISQQDLSEKLQQKLRYIYANRHQGSHYYIGATAIGNPDIKHEEAYKNMPYPDAGFRLLAVYRYWNIIQYFFPYKYLTDKDWNTVLTEHIPEFVQAENELAYEVAALKLIAEVQDTHANLWGGKDQIELSRGQYFPPVYTQLIENKLVVTDFYTSDPSKNDKMSQLVGLKVGDIITSIEGVPVDKLIQQHIALYPASNRAARLRDLAPDLLRSTEASVNIELIRDNVLNHLQLKLFKRDELDIFHWYRRDPDGKSFKMLDDNIGYITLKNIKQSDIAAIQTQFKDTQGIIIDVRNYPSTFVPFSLGSWFVKGNTPFVKFTEANFDNPGEFNFRTARDIPGEQNGYQGKLIILVNEKTQSQAEYTAMAFKAGNNITVIGSTTAGADGNLSRFSLPGGLRTAISGIGVYYPDGTETQRVGIVPDIEIHPTIQGIKSGKDELLEKAIEVIRDSPDRD